MSKIKTMEELLIKLGAVKKPYQENSEEYYVDLSFGPNFAILHEPDINHTYLWTQENEMPFTDEDQVKRWAEFLKKEISK